MISRLFLTIMLAVGCGALYAQVGVWDTAVRDLRNNTIPDFDFEVEDFTQYSPIVATYAMKIGGLEGRSRWDELLAVNAVSAVATVTLVRLPKHYIDEQRPDGTTHNSFPSGHTAVAFMYAHFQHFALGLLSPGARIVCFGAASSLGALRIMNNRHWLSDVLVGAGIGILSVEAGYWVGSKLFPSRHHVNPRVVESY